MNIYFQKKEQNRVEESLAGLSKNDFLNIWAEIQTFVTEESLELITSENIKNGEKELIYTIVD